MKNSLKMMFAGFVGGLLAVFIISSTGMASAGFFQDFLKKFSTQDPENGVQNKAVEKQAYMPAIDYENAVVKAVETASKSVVSIVISKDLPVLERCAYDPFGNLPQEFKDLFGGGFGDQFTKPCDNGKTQKKEIGGGSGFIISEDGMILTNKHVVSDEKAEYTVLTNDGSKYTAKVLARDPVQDLAIIKIDKSGLVPATLGDSSGIRLGQTAIAIGNALGEFRNTVSVGVISGLARSITAHGVNTLENLDGLIQTDAAINQGNSGGPLLNLRGEGIGINTAVASGAQSIGFAIPINQAKRDIESVKKSGKIVAAYIGVRYIAVTSEIAERQKLEADHGALVRGSDEGPGVIVGSPADKVGLKAEDIILEVNGVKIDKDHTLSSLVQQYSVGDKVSLKIQRGKQTLNVFVTLEERPQQADN